MQANLAENVNLSLAYLCIIVQTALWNGGAYGGKGDMLTASRMPILAMFLDNYGTNYSREICKVDIAKLSVFCVLRNCLLG